MDGAALGNIKRDEDALKRAYLDAGGKLGDGRLHNSCPICGDATAFMLGLGQNGFAVWACFAGKGRCAIPAGRKVSGTIVDLVMCVRGVDSKEACRWVLEKYGRTEEGRGLRTEVTAERPAAAVTQSSVLSPSVPVRKKGKLHLSVDLALEAAAFGIGCRAGNANVVLAKYWHYTDAKGEPRIVAARFNVVRNGAPAKEFTPIHRDGNGWRVGLGEWGRPGKLCPLYRLKDVLLALGS